MKISTPLTLASLFSLPTIVSAAKCGLWYTSPCVCDSDIRFCDEGQNGASDDILDQHPLWGHIQGFYKFEAYLFIMGLYLGSNPHAQDAPFYGYLNHTIIGSRDYQHRYDIYPPADASDPRMCTPITDNSPLKPFEPFFTCGVDGLATTFEGFATSSHERDGSLTTTPSLSVGASDNEISEGSYKMIPVDENTLQGSVDSDQFLVTETFVFTNKQRTEAASTQDVYMKTGDSSVLVQSTKLKLTKLPDEQAFIDGVTASHDQYNVMPMLRPAVIPMNRTCLSAGECPTEENFCQVDPKCSVSPYQEPDATIKAGPIVGIVCAVFAVLLIILYYVHRRSLAAQKERLKNMFARHVIDSLGIGKGASADFLTMEALQEEFKAIDVGKEGGDGKISKGVSLLQYWSISFVLFCFALLLIKKASCWKFIGRVF